MAGMRVVMVVGQDGGPVYGAWVYGKVKYGRKSRGKGREKV